MTDTASLTAPGTTPTTQATAQTAAATAAQPKAPTGTIAADFEVFLQMLTTQLKYQDPMNPMDSTEFASQLATFAGVEQQVLGNELLAGMSAQMMTSNMAEVAGWIGQEVRVASSVYFDGKPVTIAPNPALLADSAELVVRDETGKEIMRQSIPVSADPIEWAGVTSDGDPLPDGIYSFEVVSYAGGKEILSETAEVYAKVVEVRSKDGVNYLMLEGDIGVPASTVTAIRASKA
jgi:flagellar basal-body rod modification protein FlgD